MLYSKTTSASWGLLRRLGGPNHGVTFGPARPLPARNTKCLTRFSTGRIIPTSRRGRSNQPSTATATRSLATVHTPSVPPDTPQLRYKPLKTPTSFRLLQVLSQGGGHDDILRCRMFEVDLESSEIPQYTAISYTWHDGEDESLPQKTLPILVDDSYVNISRNLWNFLQTYRRVAGPRVVWIDQICINQDDADERAQQVQHMCSIYERAAQDLFWIGERDEHTKPAFELFDQILDLHINIVQKRWPWPTMDDLSNNEYTAAVGLPPFPSSPWESLCRTFSRTAFERIWILQELAVSRNPIVVCGNLTIPFEVLGFASKLIAMSQWGPLLHGQYRMPGSSRFLSATNNCRQRHERGEAQSLDLLLSSTRYFKSTDPADKIFALVNVSEAGRDRPMPPLIVPDYRKPVADVFRDATLHCIQDDNSLVALSGKEDFVFRKRHDLPSWVPDYSTNLVTAQLCLPPMRGLRTLYSAASSRPLVCRHSDSRNPNILGLSAYKVDRIATVADNAMSGEWISVHLEDWAEMVDINNSDTPLATRCRCMYPSSSSPVVEAFWRTLVGNTAFQPPEAPVPAAWASHFASLVRETRAKLSIMGDFEHKPEHMRVFFEGKGGERGKWPAKMPALDALIAALPTPSTSEMDGRIPRGSSYFFGSMHHASWQRRLFITETGYLGLAPQSSMPGDIVVLFAGGRMPFVVRPSMAKPADQRAGEYYTMLGDAYVHGIMDGELMNTVKEEDWQDMDLE